MKPKIVFFDCDGVLILYNTWQRLYDSIGYTHQENMRMWKAYYSGEITFKEWMDSIIKYFDLHLTLDIYRQVISKVEINPEAFEITKFLKNQSVPMAIISSGEKQYVNKTAEELGIKDFRVNTVFEFDDNGKFLDMKYGSDDPIAKVEQIKEICAIHKCKPEETFFVGDSDNDLMAFDLTRHGILYKNKTEERTKKAWKTIDNLNEIKSFLQP